MSILTFSGYGGQEKTTILKKNAVIVDTTKLNIKQMETKLINLVTNSIKKKYGNL